MSKRFLLTPRFVFYCLLLTAHCLLLPACALFDNAKLEQQRAELERLKAESGKMRQEAEALRQQSQKEEKEREVCNRAFYAFDAGRKAGDTDEAIAKYQEGLELCPNDDVAHNELGEIYMRMGRRAKAAAEFQAALRINPNFSRAQRNLDAVQ
jgi:Flp pilus assembly protein TadD